MVKMITFILCVCVFLTKINKRDILKAIKMFRLVYNLRKVSQGPTLSSRLAHRGRSWGWLSGGSVLLTPGDRQWPWPENSPWPPVVDLTFPVVTPVLTQKGGRQVLFSPMWLVNDMGNWFLSLDTQIYLVTFSRSPPIQFIYLPPHFIRVEEKLAGIQPFITTF